MTKEYILKIIYDGKSDEIKHLSEKFSDLGFCIEVDGKDIPITEEMANYMIKHVESEALGIS